ncbi:recombinase family protein [Rhizobium sp. KVB221]|uniref:Recombinase family protein n=1 Tax=Rhizobium setariae TaxID=2801340 RepID=A0A936YT52_9HYPH|nr:recombinase family protein [Rhizobium setariae]MBL0374366.1 recombinase family protein [Rhizobium setariae]
MLELNEGSGRLPDGSEIFGASLPASPHSRGKIYHVLSNPIYIGKIRHKGELHDGELKPIVDAETYEAVQRMLANSAAQSQRLNHSFAPPSADRAPLR